MNKTKRGQVDTVKKMLTVGIAMEEIADMVGLSLEEVQKISKEVTPRNSDEMDVVDFNTLDKVLSKAKK